jgi:hypothetical protein
LTQPNWLKTGRCFFRRFRRFRLLASDSATIFKLTASQSPTPIRERRDSVKVRIKWSKRAAGTEFLFHSEIDEAALRPARNANTFRYFAAVGAVSSTGPPLNPLCSTIPGFVLDNRFFVPVRSENVLNPTNPAA